MTRIYFGSVNDHNRGVIQDGLKVNVQQQLLNAVQKKKETGSNYEQLAKARVNKPIMIKVDDGKSRPLVAG